MAMESQPVASSAIAAVMYDSDTQDMQITFKDGRSYILSGVPEIEMDRMINSGSPGSYWNAFMKGRY